MYKKLGVFFGLLIITAIVGLAWNYGNRDKIAGARIGGVAEYGIDVPERVSASDPFTVNLTVDTKGKDVNAVGLHLRFNNERVSILQMDTSQSFCEFYPENRFNNDTGEIKISCGLPSPGFNGKNTIARITFEPKTVGQTNLEVLPDSAVLLNDGKGTNILKEYPAREILILGNL